MMKKSVLYIASNGRVAAIDKNDGTILWEVKLKSYITGVTGFHYSQLSVDHDKLYIGVSGVLLCLNTLDGSLVWKNELKGWGYYYVSMTGAVNDAAAASQAASKAAAIAVTV